MINDQDLLWMQKALVLAENGRYTTRPNPAVGCVIVKEGQCLAEGFHLYAGEPHAERVALETLNNQAQGATAYVTLEPCSHTNRTGPCADALIESGVARVVIAMLDPNPKVNGQGVAKLKAAGVAVDVGLLAEEAEALNIGFCFSMQHDRPYVRLKMAMSLDGRTALASGESQWISNEASRQDVQALRARSGAIITGSGTVSADAPRLSVRQNDWPEPWPYAIPQPKRVECSRNNPSLKAKGFCREKGVDLLALLQDLHAEDIREVLVEAGPTLAGAFIQANLVDELWVYLAPSLLGPEAKPLCVIDPIQSLAQRRQLKLHSSQVLEGDLRLVYTFL